MNTTELVADPEVFSFLSAQCDEVIDISKRLPEFVFRRAFGKYFAVEYAHLYKSQFGKLLYEMSQLFGDDSVSYRMLDPQPWEGVSLGLISFQPATLPERYADVMNPRIGRSKILTGANLGVFWGSSLNWGVYADRISWELAVIATDSDVDVSKILGWPSFSSEQVAEYMRCQYHIKDPSDSIAGEFNGKFLSNYSI